MMWRSFHRYAETHRTEMTVCRTAEIDEGNEPVRLIPAIRITTVVWIPPISQSTSDLVPAVDGTAISKCPATL